MTRIKHDRPQLRLADNIARELRLIGLEHLIQNPVGKLAPPLLPTLSLEATHNFILACNVVLKCEGAFLVRLTTTAKKRTRPEAELVYARSLRDTAADELVQIALTLSEADRRSFSRWVKWLEADAIKNRRLEFLDIMFEQGLKTAFNRALSN